MARMGEKTAHISPIWKLGAVMRIRLHPPCVDSCARRIPAYEGSSMMVQEIRSL